jgi:hypothetical protein
VAQLTEALHYNPEGREFDSRWCHWNFSLPQSCRSHYGTVVHSGSNRNEYQQYFLGGKGGRCVGLPNLGASKFWKSQGLSGALVGLLYLHKFWHRGAVFIKN